MHLPEAAGVCARAAALLGGDADSQVEGDALVVNVHAASPPPQPARLRAIGRKLAEHIAEASLNGRCWIGIGGPDRHPEGRTAVREAIAAVDLGRKLWAEPRVVLYTDVWVFEKLAEDESSLRRLASLLDPVAEYDRARKTLLLATVHAYFDADLSHSKTARRLGVHRHTISARLGNVEALLGRSVQEGPDRLLVELALRARRLAGDPGDPS